jgi:lipopolysaccharide/colanic/teichoic acid biosynthesis glycosyltransferase
VIRRHPARQTIIASELFRGILIKERKRADRSNQAVVLLLVAVNDQPDANSLSVWAPVFSALAAVTRETDVLGWFEWRTTVGVILPEIRDFDADTARAFEARICRQLAKRSQAERFSIRLHIHPAPKPEREEEHWPVGSVNFPEIHSRHAQGIVYHAIKRGLDVIGSLTLLLVLSPLFLLIAALVKLKSPGPVFFEQPRIGQMMKPFTMLKFRTMYMNVDHGLHHEFVSWYIKSSGDAHKPGSGGLFKLTNDPRVTPVGCFLRKTSLDELPQLWNVLRGDMSLVGPRPPLAYEVEQYKPWHCRRVLEAKPGITGLWQVAGRSRTTFDEMVRLDLRYARARSFWTDIKILLATPRAVFSGKGAC